MKYARAVLLVVFLTLSLSNMPYAGGNGHVHPGSSDNERTAGAGEPELNSVIDALSLIVIYKQMEEDRKALENALEEKYGYHRGEDPFEFKSRMLRKFMKKHKLNDKEFRDLEHGIRELKGHYRRK